jgi:hypothetical protein
MRYQVQKAPGIDGLPIPEDEPCLVVRAQDMLAPIMLQWYIDLYSTFEDSQDEVRTELQDHLRRVLAWQVDHADKVKLADR